MLLISTQDYFHAPPTVHFYEQNRIPLMSSEVFYSFSIPNSPSLGHLRISFFRGKVFFQRDKSNMTSSKIYSRCCIWELIRQRRMYHAASIQRPLRPSLHKQLSLLTQFTSTIRSILFYCSIYLSNLFCKNSLCVTKDSVTEFTVSRVVILSIFCSQFQEKYP